MIQLIFICVGKEGLGDEYLLALIVIKSRNKLELTRKVVINGLRVYKKKAGNQMEIYSIDLRGRPDERGTGNYDELKEKLNRTSKRGKVLGLILAVKVMIKVHPLLNN